MFKRFEKMTGDERSLLVLAVLGILPTSFLVNYGIPWLNDQANFASTYGSSGESLMFGLLFLAACALTLVLVVGSLAILSDFLVKRFDSKGNGNGVLWFYRLIVVETAGMTLYHMWNHLHWDTTGKVTLGIILALGPLALLFIVRKTKKKA